MHILGLPLEALVMTPNGSISVWFLPEGSGPAALPHIMHRVSRIPQYLSARFGAVAFNWIRLDVPAWATWPRSVDDNCQRGKGNRKLMISSHVSFFATGFCTSCLGTLSCALVSDELFMGHLGSLAVESGACMSQPSPINH